MTDLFPHLAHPFPSQLFWSVMPAAWFAVSGLSDNFCFNVNVFGAKTASQSIIALCHQPGTGNARTGPGYALEPGCPTENAKYE